ncbi:hypothetical protein [Mucilaginibacter sp.]|uniref:hypothetical protein n=1 Tax=Mucilaginibacter sp. TaxID=1882438 RepID=UPI0025EA63E7|nr:hypothetical protein [Mucilaginibacter sp.]
MRGYINIPKTICCKFCKICGARPVIEPAADGLYVVKCPNDNGHYQTRAGLIDIDDWNTNNTVNFVPDLNITRQVSY